MAAAIQPSRPFVAVLSAAGVAALVYWVGLDGPFLLDDRVNLLQARISELSLASVLDVATGNDSGILGRPIPAVSFALNSYLGSDDPFGYKVVNLGFHLTNALLVYVLCSLLLSVNSGEYRTGSPSRIAAAIATAIWVLHPLQVSTTLYVVQRMVLMMTLFTLGALIAYCIARRNLQRGEGAVLPWLAAVPALTLLACFSKENGALIFLYIPLIELLIFRAPHRHRPRVTALRRLGIGACAAAASIVVVALLLRIDSFADAYRGRDFDMYERLLAELHVLTLYLRQIVLPWTTSMPFYYDDVTAPTGFGAPETLAALLLGSLLIAAALLWRRLPIVSFGIGFFFATHVLESTVLPLELAFEHRNYLALLGVALPFGFAIERTLRRSNLRLASGVASVALIGTLTFMTHDRAIAWSDSRILHEQAVRHSPGSERAWSALAVAFSELGDRDTGLTVLERAEDAVGKSTHLTLQKLQILWHRDTHDESLLNEATISLASDPVVADDAILLSAMVDQRLVSTNRYPLPEQLRALYAAANGNPDRRLGRSNEAMLLAQHQRLLLGAGEHEAALGAIQRAARLAPANGEIALRLAEMLVRTGRLEEAAEPLARARRSAPRSNRAVSARMERIAKAIGDSERVSLD